MADGSLGDNTNSTGGGSLTDLIVTNQNGVQYLGLIIQAIRAVFPQLTGTTGTATGGAATLPANPVGFVTITLPNGTSAKIPYYS